MSQGQLFLPQFYEISKTPINTSVSVWNQNYINNKESKVHTENQETIFLRRERGLYTPTIVKIFTNSSWNHEDK